MKTNLQFIYGCSLLPFMKTYLRRKSLNRMLQIHEKREQALILQRIEGLFIHIDFSLRICHCPIAPIHGVLKSILYIK